MTSEFSRLTGKLTVLTINRKSKWTTKSYAKFRLFFKRRGTTIVSLAILTISVLFLAYKVTGVVAALDKWVRLEATEPNSEAAEEALQNLNNEEITLITPALLTLLSSAVAFHSLNLKIIPKKCFYCGKWARARNLKQTHDKAFYYHEECEANRKQ